MTKIEVRAALERVLRQVQSASGRAFTGIDDASKPIGDLEGFDSLTGLEATQLLEKEVGRQIEDATLFVVASGRKRALTVLEIVERIYELVVPKRAA